MSSSLITASNVQPNTSGPMAGLSAMLEQLVLVPEGFEEGPPSQPGKAQSAKGVFLVLGSSRF
jgi:hypothetical protein